jgi:hypothetical protein
MIRLPSEFTHPKLSLWRGSLAIAVNTTPLCWHGRLDKGERSECGTVRIGNALIGEGPGDPHGSSMENCDRRHAAAYYGKQPADREDIRAWSKGKRVFHWPIEFPEIFDKDRCGFDAVVGNPPYEILSAKESGIEERRQEQAYIRQVFRTCKGKINTYRLMLERGLTLLREEGVLGFVVPATLLADSTAEKLRRMILDDTTILKTVIIPEKAGLRRSSSGATYPHYPKARPDSQNSVHFLEGKGAYSDSEPNRDTQGSYRADRFQDSDNMEA